MFGILGFWSPRAERRVVEQGVHEIAPRRPDDRRMEWYETGVGTLGFGHTRLSIMDLSSGGHQPMHSPCGRWWMRVQCGGP